MGALLGKCDPRCSGTPPDPSPLAPALLSPPPDFMTQSVSTPHPRRQWSSSSPSFQTAPALTHPLFWCFQAGSPLSPRGLLPSTSPPPKDFALPDVLSALVQVTCRRRPRLPPRPGPLSSGWDWWGGRGVGSVGPTDVRPSIPRTFSNSPSGNPIQRTL